jgi:hypothetical protein
MVEEKWFSIPFSSCQQACRAAPACSGLGAVICITTGWFKKIILVLVLVLPWTLPMVNPVTTKSPIIV